MKINAIEDLEGEWPTVTSPRQWQT